MIDRVVLEFSIGVEVADADALVEAALTRWRAERAANTPESHIAEFEELIRTNAGHAIHQFLFSASEAAAREIPGVRYVGMAGSQRVLDENETFPWTNRR